MATKKEKRAKQVAHRSKMSQKRDEVVWFAGVCDGCRHTLLMAYAALVEGYKFDQKKLGEFRKRMDRYSVHMRNGVLEDTEIIAILESKGIDVMKIGDEYVDTLLNTRSSAGKGESENVLQ